MHYFPTLIMWLHYVTCNICHVTLSCTPSLCNKSKIRKEKKRNINNNLAILPSHNKDAQVHLLESHYLYICCSFQQIELVYISQANNVDNSLVVILSAAPFVLNEVQNWRFDSTHSYRQSLLSIPLLQMHTARESVVLCHIPEIWQLCNLFLLIILLKL